MNSFPLISCVCITRGRPNLLLTSIELFIQQTYPNKELIVVCEEDDYESLNALQGKKCKVVVISPSNFNTLGEIRNYSYTLCEGDYICQWDDDDWFHPSRLERQLHEIQKNFQKACVLTNWLMFDESTGSAYVSMYRLYEGSIMFHRSIFETVKYPHQKLGEDTIFLNSIIKHFGVMPLCAPNLYIYRVHSTNSWGVVNKHFEMMFIQAQYLGEEISKKVSRIMKFDLDISEAAQVLNSSEILSAFNFFQFNSVNFGPDQLLEYMSRVSTVDVALYREVIEYAKNS